MALNTNKYKNILIIKLISFYEQYKKPMQITLPIIIILLAGWLTIIILEPIQFEKEKNYRYTFIKEKLIDIRSAQLAYKEKNGQFTNDFDELINFVKIDSFVLVQKTDTLIEYYNKVYREMQFKDRGSNLMRRIIEDTKELGKVELNPKFEGNQMIMIIQPN